MQQLDGPLHETESLEALKALREDLGDLAGPEFVPGEIVNIKGYKYSFAGVHEGKLLLNPEGPTRALMRKRERRKAKREPR